MVVFFWLAGGWFVRLIGIVFGLSFAYVSLLWMLAAFADEQTLQSRAGWLFVRHVVDPFGFFIYLLVLLFLGIFIGLSSNHDLCT